MQKQQRQLLIQEASRGVGWLELGEEKWHPGFQGPWGGIEGSGVSEPERSLWEGREGKPQGPSHPYVLWSGHPRAWPAG